MPYSLWMRAERMKCRSDGGFRRVIAPHYTKKPKYHQDSMTKNEQVQNPFLHTVALTQAIGHTMSSTRVWVRWASPPLDCKASVMGLFVLWHQKGVCCLQEQNQDSLESEPGTEYPVTLQKCRTHLVLLSCYMLFNKPFVLLTQNKHSCGWGTFSASVAQEEHPRSGVT